MKKYLLAAILALGMFATPKANACDYTYYHIAFGEGHVWWATVCMNNGSPVNTSYIMIWM